MLVSVMRVGVAARPSLGPGVVGWVVEMSKVGMLGERPKFLHVEIRVVINDILHKLVLGIDQRKCNSQSDLQRQSPVHRAAEPETVFLLVDFRIIGAVFQSVETGVKT